MEAEDRQIHPRGPLLPRRVVNDKLGVGARFPCLSLCLSDPDVTPTPPPSTPPRLPRSPSLLSWYTVRTPWCRLRLNLRQEKEVIFLEK